MIENRKLNDSSFADTAVEGLDDRPKASAYELKQRFDANVKAVVVPAFNALIDDFGKTEDGESGADNIGCTPVSGGTANTVQGVLEEILSAATVVNVSLVAANWSSNVQTLTVAGVTSTKHIIVSLSSAATATARAQARAAYIYATAQGTNSVTFRYDGTLPTTSIPMSVMIMRG